MTLALAMGAGEAMAGRLDWSADTIARSSFEANRFPFASYSARLVTEGKGGHSRTRSIFVQMRLHPDESNSILVRFSSPSELKGTATLTVDHRNVADDLWIYLPAMKRVRRLLSSNKRDSYVGTEFSYGDLIGYDPEEWVHEIVSEEDLEGEVCWVLHSTPGSRQVADEYGYGSRLSWIRQGNLIPMKIELYSPSANNLVKTIWLRDVQEHLEGKWQAHHIEAIRPDESRRSELLITDFDVTTLVTNSDISPQALRD